MVHMTGKMSIFGMRNDNLDNPCLPKNDDINVAKDIGAV